MLKKSIRAIIIALFICNLFITNIYAEPKMRKTYSINLDSLNVNVKQYLTSLVIDDDTKAVYMNNTYVGNVSSDPQTFVLSTTNYSVTASVSISNLSCNASVNVVTEKHYTAVFDIQIEDNSYYICNFYPDYSNNPSYSIKSRATRNGDLQDFGSFSYTYGNESKTFNVQMTQSDGAVYVNGKNVGNLGNTNIPIVFEYIGSDFPITNIDYQKTLPMFNWNRASQTNTIFYNRNFGDISFKEKYDLSNEYLNLPTVEYTFGATVDEYARVGGTSTTGTGVWQKTGNQIEVVCEYYENNKCGNAIRNEFPRYWAVWAGGAPFGKSVGKISRSFREDVDGYLNYYPTGNWVELGNAFVSSNNNEIYKQQRAQPKSWSNWSAWAAGYTPSIYQQGENYKAEEKELYKYRTYAWEDATDWNTSAAICEYAGDGKYTTKTGEDEKCGQEVKWYEFSNYGSPSASMYGETGGCNSYYGAKDVCGQHLKWYEFSNYGGASATMYGETGGCNSYYGANGVCGYNTCANAACGYNTCEAQSCGYATCTNASACGYKTCRADACGTESYVSSYSCAVYHSKTCTKSESYSCTKSTYGSNCSKCGSTKTCKRCYVGSSMETNCSYCGSTTTCNSCSYNYSTTCSRNVNYDCSYTTYDGACYSTRNKSCATSACGANTCTSATCGYNKCEDSSCGAKTCTTSACGNKSCTWYTCPTDKTPVYENNECTWYTCPSEKEAVYGNKSCTLYKCQKKTYSAWSSANVSCPYLSGADVECVSDGTYYRYASRVLGEWGSWYDVSSFTHSDGDTNYQYRYAEIDERIEEEKATGSVGSSSGWWSGKKEFLGEQDVVHEIVQVGGIQGWANYSYYTEDLVIEFQDKYATSHAGESVFYSLSSNTDKRYVLWEDFESALKSSTAYIDRLDSIKNKELYQPYLYFYAWRFISSSASVPIGSSSKSVIGEQIINYYSNGSLIESEEKENRDTKVIYFDYRDPLTHYKDELPENWQGYEYLVDEIKNSDLDTSKIKVKLSANDILAMKEYLENGGYDNVSDCEMIRQFSYIFVTTDSELQNWLNSGSGCKIGD